MIKTKKSFLLYFAMILTDKISGAELTAHLREDR